MAKQSIYEDYEVPDDDRLTMLAMLGLNQDVDKLPERVRRKYIEFRIPADRISQAMTHFHLWSVVCAAGSITVPKKETAGLLQLWKEKKIHIGDEVLCTLASKKNLPAVLINVTNDGRSLVAMSNGDERQFDVGKVYVEKQ